MKKVLYMLYCTVIFLFGCTQPSDSDISPDDVFPFKGKLRVGIWDSVNPDEPTEINTYLFLKTVEEYGCYNFVLNTEHYYAGSRLIVAIGDFVPLFICAPLIGPANARIQLELSLNIETMIIGKDPVWDRYNIVQSGNDISLTPIDTTFTILFDEGG